MKQKHFERFMIVFAAVEPIATIPQIIQVWGGHGSQGVSLLTWSFYSITSFVWLMYGAVKKDKPLIVSGSLWVLSQSLVVIGILLK